jgi:DNA mismatch repair ATPase MutS
VVEAARGGGSPGGGGAPGLRGGEGPSGAGGGSSGGDAPTTTLYLLDEPLQGTNEAERRVAVQTILGHLLEAGAVGMVATHDLRLDQSDRLGPAARAVHFEGVVREDGSGPILSFDYRLRAGRATSTNALALLRAVGLGAGETVES